MKKAPARSGREHGYCDITILAQFSSNFDPCALGEPEGVKVYRASTLNTKVHARADCRGLVAHVKGSVHELNIVDLSTPDLCRICFPDAPRIKVFHGRCLRCRQRRALPCPHNGAVQVLVSQRDGRSRLDPGQSPGVLVQTRWVWPENAHHYTLVNPGPLD